MKRIAIIAALLLTAISSFAQTGKSIYQKYSEFENVSSVYISPAMFRLIGKIPNSTFQNMDMDLAPIIKSLSGMYIVSSENQKINSQLKADADKFIANGSYELVLEAKEQGEAIRIYSVGTEKIVTGIVMIANEEDETTFICLDGKMDREDLDKTLETALSEKKNATGGNRKKR